MWSGNTFLFLCSDTFSPQVEKEIGEKRLVSFHGVGLSVAPEINFSEISTSCETAEEVRFI